MLVAGIATRPSSAHRGLAQQVKLDSLILAEQFYFFTVVIMWLIHVGFMAYEAGVARRKNVMSTAMKNILTIAVVTPTFYYFGWYIYGCFQEGWPKSGHDSPDALPGFCGLTAPGARGMGPNLQDHISARLLPRVPALLVDDGLDHVRRADRARAPLRLPDPRRASSARWSGSWTPPGAGAPAAGSTTRFGFHDAIASAVVHGVAGVFTLGVLLNLGPRIGKYDVEGRARTFRPHNTHLTLMGLMLIFTGFYGFYAACLVIQSTAFPGWLNIYLSPTTLGAIAMVITFGFAGGFTGGWFASKGDPFWTLSGGLAGVIAVSAGADVYHPSLAYLLSFTGGCVAVWAGGFIEKRLRVDDAVGAVAVHGVCGFYGVFLVGIFAGGYPTGINNIDSSFGGQLMGSHGVPAARLPARVRLQLDPQEDRTSCACRPRSSSRASTWPSSSRTSSRSSSGRPRSSSSRTAGRSTERRYCSRSSTGSRPSRPPKSEPEEESCSTHSRTTNGATRSRTSGRSAEPTPPARTS